MCWLQHVAVGVALALLAATPAVADPALWVVHSPTATVYLFGTIHVLPQGIHWRDATLESAVRASDSLYVEVDDETRARTTALIYRYGIDHANPAGDPEMPYDVRIYLHPDSDNYVTGWGRLLEALAHVGFNSTELQSVAVDAAVPGGIKTLESMQPWLAALALSNTATRRAGYLPKFGADTVLENAFRAHDKPVFSFETTHDQIAVFAGLPQSSQLDLLQSVLGGRTRSTVETSTLVHDWLAGDTAAIDAAVVAPMREHMPELYQSLLVDRNQRWARRIARLLTRHATIFVAVGAGHLVGPDSVQVQLRKLGVESERVR